MLQKLRRFSRFEREGALIYNSLIGKLSLIRQSRVSFLILVLKNFAANHGDASGIVRIIGASQKSLAKVINAESSLC